MASLEEPPIRNVSDTALWVAVYRAQENDRPDALFQDPFARMLAGERGARIAAQATITNKYAWSMVERTWLVDQIIEREIAAGTDMIVNLAAGLDARPYRLTLPPELPWVEVDLPGILEYKEEILAHVTPHCQIRRERCDLADASARQALFARLGREAHRALVITEGLLVYLTNEQVTGLARDLAAQPGLQRWAFDLASPSLLRLLNKNMGADVAHAGAPFRFAPAEGPDFFAPCGWHPLSVQTMLRSAYKHHRLNLPLRLAAMLPQKHPGEGRRPWSAVCLLSR